MERMTRNREIMSKNKQDLRVLENMFITSKIDNLEELIKERKEELVGSLIEYKEEMLRTVYDKKGEEHQVLKINPLVMQNYFFKSINPIANREPAYNAEKLAIVFQLYVEIVEEVNKKVGDFIPNVSSFCSFAGLTTSTFNSYKRSNDEDLRIVYEKISDYCFNSNVTLAQVGQLSEKSTIYRMNAEQNKKESAEPQIHIHADGLNMGMIKDRLKELQEFNEKKTSAIEVKDGEK